MIIRKSVFLLMGWGALVTSCQSKTQTPPPQAAQVTAFEVEPQDVPATFEFVGVAKSSHPIEIRARVEGYLNSIDYVEGSMVKPNDPLFHLDPSPFQASVEAAKGELAREEAILWRAERALERIEPLFAKNAVSQRDLDDATASVLAAEAAVLVAESNLVQAQLNLSYTKITSPVMGLTGRALYREGTLITPNVNGLLTYVVVLDPIWVDFNVSDNELLQGKMEKQHHTIVLPKQSDYEVSLELADGSLFPYKGKVNFASPILDPTTGTMTVRAVFANPLGELLPGQFVRAKVSGAIHPHALFVPQQSVFQGKEGMNVFVIDKTGTVHQQPVEVGALFDRFWIITQGLNPGDVVIADGVNKVHSGMKVEILSFVKSYPPQRTSP